MEVSTRHRGLNDGEACLLEKFIKSVWFVALGALPHNLQAPLEVVPRALDVFWGEPVLKPIAHH